MGTLQKNGQTHLDVAWLGEFLPQNGEGSNKKWTDPLDGAAEFSGLQHPPKTGALFKTRDPDPPRLSFTTYQKLGYLSEKGKTDRQNLTSHGLESSEGLWPPLPPPLPGEGAEGRHPRLPTLPATAAATRGRRAGDVWGGLEIRGASPFWCFFGLGQTCCKRNVCLRCFFWRELLKGKYQHTGFLEAGGDVSSAKTVPVFPFCGGDCSESACGGLGPYEVF